MLRNIFNHAKKLGNTVGIKVNDLIIHVYRKQSKCRVSVVNITRTSNIKESEDNGIDGFQMVFNEACLYISRRISSIVA